MQMHPFHDAHGTVTVEMPFPKTWKVNSRRQQGEPTITGPNGLSIVDFPGQSFLYTNDPYMQQAYRASGQRLRPMPGIEQVIQQDLAPWCAGQGLQLVKHYEVPEVSCIDKWYNDQLYKVMPTQTDIRAIGTEWRHESGASYFILMHLVVSNGNGMQTWYYSCSGLQAEKDHFEEARKQLIFGLANARYRLEPIMAYNQREAQAAGRSWAAHNQRMAQNQANFEARQRAFVESSSAVNDSIINGWRSRNASSDRMHARTIDGIHERENVVNTSTGQMYQVDSGSNQYWMNQGGDYYMGVDDHNYNPNLDNGFNGENWEQLESVD